MKKGFFQSAIITGGSSGIGLAIAELAAAGGSDVCILARNEERLKTAGERIKARFVREDQKAEYISLDISDSEAVQSLLGGFLEKNSPPDLLVNSAGIVYPDYFENIPDDAFRRLMDTNVTGTWNVCKCVLPYMKKAGRGTLVNVSSIAGFVGVFGYSAYSTSKFAVIGFSEVLRSELKPHNIKVHVLCPPDTDTPQFAEEEKMQPKETKAVSGTVKVVSPEFVADACFRDISRNKFMIIPSAMGKITYTAKRLFPGFVFSTMDKDIKKVKTGSE